MNIQIETAEYAYECSNSTCQHSPQYHNHIIGKNWRIKKGTQIALIFFVGEDGEDYEVYCCDCIDVLYRQMKIKLDKKLWAFQ